MKVHNLLVTGSLTSGGENITEIAGTVTYLSSSLLTSMYEMSSSLKGMMATTSSNVFVGNQTISGSVIPAVNGSYDLGSPTNEFRHLYLSSASLYIDGTKVLGSTTQELQITTDAGQSFKILEAGSDTITLQAADGNITLATSGGGDVILDPTTGIIALKGTTTVYAGNKILSSDGNAIQFGNSVTMTGSLIVTGFIETQELRTTYISSSILYRSGSTKFGDELTDTHAFSGSVLISGSISVPGSNLVSGSAQVSFTETTGFGTYLNQSVLTSSSPSFNAVTSSNQVTVVNGSTTSTYGFRHEGAGKYVRIGTPNASYAYIETDANNGVMLDSKTTVNGDVYYSYSQSTVRSLWGGGYGGVLQIVSDNSTSSRYVRIGLSDSNNSWIGGMKIDNNYLATFDGDILFSKGVDPKISSGTGIGLNIDGNALYLNRYSQGNIVMVPNGGNVGIGDSPSKKLTINFGTSISDGLLVTGSQRQETRFKSSGEHSNVFIDSAHSNIYLPTLALLRSGTSFGEVKLQRASNSDSVGSYTESEMIMGSTTTVPVSIKTNEVRRILVESGGNVNVYNALTVSNNIQARNFNKYIYAFTANQSYVWADVFVNTLSGFFDDAGLYRGFLRSSNGAHYNGYYFDILVGSKGYGGNSSQYRVQNVTSAMSPYVGGCGGSPISAIDNTGFTKVQNPCYEVLELFITRLG